MTNDKLRAAAELERERNLAFAYLKAVWAQDELSSPLPDELFDALVQEGRSPGQLDTATCGTVEPPAKRDPKVEAALFIAETKGNLLTQEFRSACIATGNVVPVDTDALNVILELVAQTLAVEVRRLESQGQVAAVEDAKLAEALKYIADNIAFYGSVEDVMQISIVLKALRAAQRELAELRAALKPLVEVANRTERVDESTGIWSQCSTVPGQSFVLTVGHCRKARAASDGKEGA